MQFSEKIKMFPYWVKLFPFLFLYSIILLRKDCLVCLRQSLVITKYFLPFREIVKIIFQVVKKTKLTMLIYLANVLLNKGIFGHSTILYIFRERNLSSGEQSS